MKKKKIAVLSTMWANEILSQYLSGLQEILVDENVDIYVFGSFAAYSQDPSYLQGELNIYNLPHYEDFDAVCLFINSLSYPDIIKQVCDRCDAAGIPVFMCGSDDGVHFFTGVDNRSGTTDLAHHLIETHGVRDILYIAGDKTSDESNVRLHTLEAVMQEYGLTLAEDHIFYSDWTPFLAAVFLDNYLKAGNPIPDAFICANDSLAISICEELANHGYHVPQDCVVTGFDNSQYAQYYDPSISSVDQHFDHIGRQTATLILDCLAGRMVEQKTVLGCEYIPSESCGCTSARDFDKFRRLIGKNNYNNMLKISTFDMKISTIERIVSQKTQFQDLSEILKAFNTHDRDFEGASFSFIVDPAFEESIYHDTSTLSVFGYPDQMQALLAKDSGVVITNQLFPTRELIPCRRDGDKGRTYLFLPMHENGAMLGYLIWGDPDGQLKDSRMLRRYAERMDLILSKLRNDLKMIELNKQLRRMNETDPLTQTGNRAAYSNREALLQKKMEEGECEPFALVVFDVNNLKTVNDSQGHEVGDLYIQSCCNFITMSFPGAAIYRIGGDEFVALLTGQCYNNRMKYLNQMREQMRVFSGIELPISQRVSIASGIACYDPDTDESVQDVFNRADSEMYENKKYMKKSS